MLGLNIFQRWNLVGRCYNERIQNVQVNDRKSPKLASIILTQKIYLSISSAVEKFDFAVQIIRHIFWHPTPHFPITYFIFKITAFLDFLGFDLWNKLAEFKGLFCSQTWLFTSQKH